MRNFKFVYVSEIIKTAVTAVLFEAFAAISIIVTSADIREFGFAFLLPLPVLALMCVPYRKLYSQYRITEDGVESRYCKLKWNEIEDCTVIEPAVFRRGHFEKKVFLPVICLGKISEGDFFHQNTKECVFVPLTRQNLQLIKEYCRCDNQKIKDMTDTYNDVVREK